MTSPSRLIRSYLAGALLIAGAAWFLLAGGAFQADAVTAENQFEGTVMSAGASMLMIQSTPDNDMLLFRVESNPQITKDGERVTLEKVTSGDVVTVVFKKSKDDE